MRSSELCKTLQAQIVNIAKKGFFHIFGSSIINNIVLFISNILIARIIPKESYGVYVYANNIVNFFLLARGLGLSSGIIQFVSEARDTTIKDQIYRYSLSVGNRINLVLSVGIIAYAFLGPVTIDGAKPYVIAMCFLPYIQWIYDYFLTYFRAQRMNKAYSRITNLNTILYFVFSVLGCWIWGIVGIIFGRYISYIISFFFIWKKMDGDLTRILKSNGNACPDKKPLLKYSIGCFTSNALSELLYLLDVYLIGLIIADSAILASYKVATQIPTALLIIPTSAVIFIYPYFAEHHLDKNWLKKNIRSVLLILLIVNCLLGLLGYTFAPSIIELLWGTKYEDALPVFRILMINYVISGTLRVPCGNILAMLRKVKANIFASAIAGISNIIFDIVFISRWGSLGAAYATVLVVLITSAFSFLYLVRAIRELPNLEEPET